MNARLDTLTDEMSEVTTYVGRIARRQARLGGLVASPSPSPEASNSRMTFYYFARPYKMRCKKLRMLCSFMPRLWVNL